MTVQLNEQQINAFNNRLKQRYLELRREISADLLRADQEQYSDLAGRVHDTGDEALADLLVDIELASITRQVQEIRDIDAALLRIAEGGYGECSDCAEPIALARLEAYPTARRCIVCQEAHDRTHMHDKRSTM
ncbi:TraR/DksA family transcriptional regulator [Methylogaea oryzae]|uniref:Conjugal transfer protein TraR n=1 Tax=Methylogaea oryzae TaxID=1295382 RepID=A0A8D4VMZ2_9GAMM|nr:TraR/DksA family transcriptional regulator [Methylogaea oryzae]BBL70835.1 conjugal transfer protein TraR [Methylogaea oryzae]